MRLMIKLVRLLHRLSQSESYQSLLNSILPETARISPCYYSVMMGYDFHLSATGPKLIEINTNAGGYWFAYLSHNPNQVEFAKRSSQRLLASFISEYQLFEPTKTQPTLLAIVDTEPESQFLFPEMQAFAALFQRVGIDTVIIDPSTLSLQDNSLFFKGHRVDMIYNRHCDFYLETPAMAAIKAAWMSGSICLSPNPRHYGLLADKRRMTLFSNPAILKTLNLSIKELDLLKTTIPLTQSLATLPQQQVWESRKQWVFKPDTGYASRGVYVGNKLTTGKLAELDPKHTLIQEWIPPSQSRYQDELPFKTDFRVFAYQDKILGISARLYQGQVTNLRTPNGGFAKVVLV